MFLPIALSQSERNFSRRFEARTVKRGLVIGFFMALTLSSSVVHAQSSLTRNHNAYKAMFDEMFASAAIVLPNRRTYFVSVDNADPDDRLLAQLSTDNTGIESRSHEKWTNKTLVNSSGQPAILFRITGMAMDASGKHFRAYGEYTNGSRGKWCWYVGTLQNNGRWTVSAEAAPNSCVTSGY
jgi:hypothetical protein